MIHRPFAVATFAMNRKPDMRTEAAPADVHEDAAAAIQWAATLIRDEQARVVKDAGLSLPQFSVLRILLATGEALSCSEIAGRMVSRDPDITRLIDKLEKQGLVARERCRRDRRVVRSRITQRGTDVARPLDERVSRLHESMLGKLGHPHLNDMALRLRSLRRPRP